MSKNTTKKAPITVAEELSEGVKEYIEVSSQEALLLRDRVVKLIPSFLKMRDLCKSTMYDVEVPSQDARTRILTYFRLYPGVIISKEELMIVSGISEYGRRIRELRTEYGWPIVTNTSGRPDLPAGYYMLEEDRQAAVHDRKIPDPVRVKVLDRDHYACRKCNWKPIDRNSYDPRKLLELHHLEYHHKGGTNTIDNLVTLCNVHHDEVHLAEMYKNSVFQWLGILTL